jgi:inosine-uridine nucleoside N-ribohydrolase
MRSHIGVAAIFVVVFGHISAPAQAQHPSAPEKAPEKIIIDTDIGGDIDDAFAVALALRSPELKILGFSTVTGDPEARAKLLDRMLGETGHPDLPVAVGLTANFAVNPALSSLLYTDTVSQRRYAEGGHFARSSHSQAVEFLEEQIRRNPGEITLVCIGALTNIGALIDKDREIFRKLKRIVIMGGAIERGYSDPRYSSVHGPEPEANIVVDIPAAQKVFTAGVPLYVMPLDSTANLQLDEVKRGILFSRGTPLTDALTLLYHQWAFSGAVTPVLFDAMTVAYMINPSLCPVQPMRIRVDEKGFTRVESGTPNAQVCLHSDADTFFRFYMDCLLAQ